MGVSGTSPESIAYQEGLRAVTSQEASLDELRSRSALLFTGMALATSFLGQNAISDGWGFWEVTAVIDLGVISLLITVILRPRDWRFRLDAERLVVDFVVNPTEPRLTRCSVIWHSGMRRIESGIRIDLTIL